jgi:hypothetical protein
MSTFEVVNTDDLARSKLRQIHRSDADQLNAAADQAGRKRGREGIVVANEFLEAQISQGYVRGVILDTAASIAIPARGCPILGGRV